MTTQTLDDTAIRETAYLFWLDDGQPVGRDQDHWLRAIDALTPAKRKPVAKKSRCQKSCTKSCRTQKGARDQSDQSKRLIAILWGGADDAKSLPPAPTGT